MQNLFGYAGLVGLVLGIRRSLFSLFYSLFFPFYSLFSILYSLFSILYSLSLFSILDSRFSSLFSSLLFLFILLILFILSFHQYILESFPFFPLFESFYLLSSPFLSSWYPFGQISYFFLFFFLFFFIFCRGHLYGLNKPLSPTQVER